MTNPSFKCIEKYKHKEKILPCKFPNINLIVPLKIFYKDNKTYSDFYSLNELFDLLPCIHNAEIGGEYDIQKGFIVDPNASNFDKQEGRPYTIMNIKSKVGIVWHSHPFNHEGTEYPSIEDFDLIRQNPHLIFLLLVKRGIYVLSANREYTSVEKLFSFYRSMQSNEKMEDWDCEEIEESFLNNPNNKNKWFFYQFITSPNALNDTIKLAYSKKIINME